ncbi:MAG: ATP-binding protein [Candidatus Thorarchaeota archaeon]|nr:MAG: ATP-binding protein [Candidatus Thorarchaeota archaeon]
MGTEDTLAEALELIDPERISASRLSQYSIREKAKWFHSIIKRHEGVRSTLDERGVEFGGRVLLVGPPGTDFQAFIDYIGIEVPLRILRFRISNILSEPKYVNAAIQTGFETAKRSSPCLLYIQSLESLCPSGTPTTALLIDELERTTWDKDEVLVIASTSKPDALERSLMGTFDRLLVSDSASLEDRVRALEDVLRNREDVDVAQLAELTDGWSFIDVKHLAVSILMNDEIEADSFSGESLERLIRESGVHPVGRGEYVDSLIARTSGRRFPSVETTELEYPEEFLDQLYLEAVGESYSDTQRVIETLNSSLPLSKKDLDFLGKFPFLIMGSAEERLMRLLKAKRSADKLRRLMGRQ